ncbi:MAG: hypothetical protein IJN15_04275, partial [Clostridia bacterium]|nr:hypothetical protein [Clostridia bacterium]
MKNIKKFINKNLAVFLSLAIIVTTLLPVMSGVVGAEGFDPAAIAELKAAWADLTVTYELVPTEVWDGSLSGGVAPLGSGLNVYDSSVYTDSDLTDTSVLGSKYATYTATLASASDWKDYIVYKLADGSVTDLDVTLFKDFSLYVKSASGIAARPRMHISSQNTPIAVRWYDPSYFAADVFSTGAWKKISMSDLSEVNAFINCLTNYSNPTDYKIQGLGFDLTKTGATGEFVTGSASVEMYAASAATLALADTDAAAFVAAAKEFNDNAVAKNYFASGDAAYARFTTALSAFEEDEEAAKIKALKDAWSVLDVSYEMVPTEVWDGSLNQGAAPLGTGLNVYDSSVYTDADLTDKSVLGSKYATYNVALAGASDWKDYVVYKLADGGVTDFDVTQFKSFSLYVKSASGILARPRMHISSDATPITVRWNDPSYFAADVLSTGAWKEIKMSDLAEVNAFVNCLTNYSNPTDYKISGIGFDLSKTGATGEFVTGSLNLVMSAASSATLALADTDAAAFVAAAKAFYDKAVTEKLFAEGNADFEAFKTALNNIMGESAKLDSLKNAWKALTYAGYDDAVPMNYIAGANTGANYATTDAPQEAPESTNNRKVTLGSSITLMHYNEYTASSFFANGKITDVPIGSITDMYFYYKATGDVATWFHAIGNNGTTRKDAMLDSTLDASKVVLPATDGEWVKVSFMDYLETINLPWSTVVSQRLTGSTQLASVGLQAKSVSGSADIYMSEL